MSRQKNSLDMDVKNIKHSDAREPAVEPSLRGYSSVAAVGGSQSVIPSGLGGLENLGVQEELATDESLVQSYLEGRSREVFEELVRRYERELYTFLRRFLGDTQAAEDVFQATFLSVHLRIDQFEKGRKFRPWLYAIASNKAIDHMRRNRRHQIGSLHATNPNSDKDEFLAQRLASDALQPDALAMNKETGERVREAVRQLSEPTQELIHLAFYQGMKYADIADVLEIPLGTVKSRVFTAIRKLNSIWSRMEGSRNPGRSDANRVAD